MNSGATFLMFGSWRDRAARATWPGSCADELAARNDDVEAGIAGAQLGEQLVVGGKQLILTSMPAAFLKSERGFADIGVPVVEIELWLSLGPGGGLLADRLMPIAAAPRPFRIERRDV
jgi:hypothetical protein